MNAGNKPENKQRQESESVPGPPAGWVALAGAGPGDEGWDYLTFDQAGHRLFVSHGTRVVVLDADRLSVIGEISDTPGVHGIALSRLTGTWPALKCVTNLCDGGASVRLGPDRPALPGPGRHAG